MITLEQLQERKKKLDKATREVKDTYNRLVGALSVVEDMIQELQGKNNGEHSGTN